MQLVVLIILIPLPLFFASTIYGEAGLTTWVVIGIIWTFCSAFSVVLYPLWESRAAIGLISRGVVKVRFFDGEYGMTGSKRCRMYRISLPGGVGSMWRRRRGLRRLRRNVYVNVEGMKDSRLCMTASDGS
jgi:hypothetical protein